MTTVDPTIDQETGQRLCYYKLLDISIEEQDAAKIKKAYLRASLKYHPDRCEDKEYAHIMFKYLSEAYTTISTPQERAYYDRNRHKILNIKSEDEFADRETHLNFNLARSSRAYQEFDDAPNGFYTVYNNFFTMLNQEENRAAVTQLANEKLNQKQADLLTFKSTQVMPSFGDSNAKRAQVHAFYEYYKNFSTIKQFQFADVYSSEKENSKMRKLISNENEKYRAQRREEFNQKVYDLVLYIKRRDPRLDKFVAEEAAQQQQKLLLQQQQQQEQQQLQQELAIKIKQEKLTKLQELTEKLNQGSISPQEMLELEKMTVKSNPEVDRIVKQWEQMEKRSQQTAKQVLEEQQKPKRVEDFGADKEMIKQGIALDQNDKLYCKICNQRFGLIGEFKPHVNSKRHRTAVAEAEKDEAARRKNQSEEAKTKKESRDKRKIKEESESEEEQEIDVSPPKEEPEMQLKSQKKKRSNKIINTSDEEDIDDDMPKKKQKKEDVVKQQELLKQQQQEKDLAKLEQMKGETKAFICIVCSKQFDSKTKLFKHIEETKHAALKTEVSGKGKKQK
ncbi:Chaperone_protein DnaJ subfamily C [Hexamita inflata]|uniref:Chaperone protein DnaJ subfamily C n=1 Tax=Hexamita inflata TaxID=28002 RepID=A0AA86PUK8_9EUKA|nr:Chaperone protein DnaJ subfamily C [Hexamita inflata]